MNQNKHEIIDSLLKVPDSFSIQDFNDYVTTHLKRKNDHRLAVHELDKQVGLLQNFILSFSVILKQQLMLSEVYDRGNNRDNLFYTKEEVANRYRVSLRTVGNWMADGLEVLEIGGVKRINNQAIEAFVKTKRTKKPNWKSIARRSKGN